jgi:hypothetical protein
MFIAILIGTIVAGFAAGDGGDPVHFAWLMLVTASAVGSPTTTWRRLRYDNRSMGPKTAFAGSWRHGRPKGRRASPKRDSGREVPTAKPLSR